MAWMKMAIRNHHLDDENTGTNIDTAQAEPPANTNDLTPPDIKNPTTRTRAEPRPNEANLPRGTGMAILA